MAENVQSVQNLINRASANAENFIVNEIIEEMQMTMIESNGLTATDFGQVTRTRRGQVWSGKTPFALNLSTAWLTGDSLVMRVCVNSARTFATGSSPVQEDNAISIHKLGLVYPALAAIADVRTLANCRIKLEIPGSEAFKGYSIDGSEILTPDAFQTGQKFVFDGTAGNEVPVPMRVSKGPLLPLRAPLLIPVNKYLQLTISGLRGQATGAPDFTVYPKIEYASFLGS